MKYARMRIVACWRDPMLYLLASGIIAIAMTVENGEFYASVAQMP